MRVLLPLQLEIQAPRGVPIGYVAQIWHPFLPKFKIQNEKKEDVLKISGPFFVCNCGGDVDFHVSNALMFLDIP